MNWVDAAIIGVVIFFAVEGQKRGFLVQLFDIIGLLVSLVTALTFYTFASQLLTNLLSVPRIGADPIGFLLVWIATEAIFFTLFTGFFKKIFEKTHQTPVNKYLGFIPSSLNALLLASFLLIFAISLPLNTQQKGDIFKSKIAPHLINSATTLEKPFNNIFGPITKKSFTFLTVSPTEKECQKLGFSTPSTSTDKTSETVMLEALNKERAKVGSSPLVQEDNIRQIARDYSKDMINRNYFCHYSPEGKDVGDRLSESNVSYATAGENLAFAPNVSTAHAGLMNSPGHKRNILDPAFRKVGIGVVDAGIYGKVFVQVFTN